MKRLTISTYKYNQLLDDFATDGEKNGWLIIQGAGARAKVFFKSCRYCHIQPAFGEGLMALLTHIAMQENPVFRHSPKLQEMANDLRSTPVYTAALKNLTRYLKRNNTLHLEGYVAFRMGEYREKLDMMSYSLIKKLKLIQED